MQYILKFKKLLVQADVFIDDAYIAIKDNYVIEFGKFSQHIKERFKNFKMKYYGYTAVSGFINAHTHLVFSNIPANKRFSSFLDFATFLKNRTQNWSFNDYKNSYLKGIKLLQNSNTTFTLDFTPYNILPEVNNLKTKGIILFPEFIASQKQLVKKILRQVKNYKFIALHSLYSVHKNLIESIRKKLPDSLYALHFSEFEDENLFLKKGAGSICDLFKLYGRNVNDFSIPYKNPTEYLLTLPIINNNLLLIHANFITENQIRTLSKFNCVFVKCPRSSVNLNNNISNIEILIKNNHRLVLGTDSLASSPSLDVLDEAKFLKKHFKVANKDLWKILTGYYLNGLFEDYSFGYIVSGKKLLLNIYNIKISDFNEFLEGIFNTNIKPLYKIIT